MKPEKMATFKDPTVIQGGSDANIANTPLGVAAIEVARRKIGTDDHAYFTFEEASWLVRPLHPHSFWVEPSSAPLTPNAVPKIQGNPPEKKRFGFDSAVFLAASTAFFYCAGTALEKGYFRALELDSNMLERSPYETLFLGFLESSGYFLILLFIATSVSFIWQWALAPYINFWLDSLPTRRAALLKFISKMHGEQPLSEDEKRRKRSSFVWLFAFVFFVAIFVAFSKIEQTGIAGGMLLKQKIESNSPELSKDMISVEIGNQTLPLLHLQCGSRNCAGLHLPTKTIYYFPATGYTKKLTPLDPKTKK